MKIFTACAAAIVLSAGMASAQPVATTATAVGGDTGNPNYPVRVEGANGITYACKPGAPGATALPCRRLGADKGLFNQGAGLGSTGAAVALGALVLVAVASGGDGSSTTTTN